MAALAGSLGLTLLLGFASVTWQWLRAEANVRYAQRERERAESNLGVAKQVVDDMYALVHIDLNATSSLSGFLQPQDP